MKTLIKSFVIINLVLISSNIIFSQAEFGKCTIGAVGRFSNIGVELRWIPDNKTILHLGFDNSYTIERSESDKNQFIKLNTVKTFSRTQWDSLLIHEKDTETINNLELAMDFLFTQKSSERNEINLDKGIAELNERKSKEDMIYAVFVFTAIKNAKVAEALALGYVDNTAQSGKSYDYRIKLNAKSSIYQINDGLVSVKTVIDADKYKNMVIVYPGDKRLSFAWPSSKELSGYYVERATEGESEFILLNTTPFYAASGPGYDGPTNGTFTDDSLSNYKWYRYRFYGNTAFGNKIMFAEVKGMPKDLTPPISPIIHQAKHIKPKEVQIDWEINNKDSDIKGFIVARSEIDTGNFQILNKTLLPEKSRSFIDKEFKADGINYYIVYALDTSGNISASYPRYVALIDSIPPAKPQILSALMDSFGVVTITIKQGHEKDLKGYKLFKANSKEHEFSAIKEAYKKDRDDTSRFKLVITDTNTLQSLTPKIYFRIRALDFNYNQSVFSDIMEVRRPDTIPPVTPIFTDIVVGENKIQLQFVQSPSLDVKEHILYRKNDLNNDWEIIFKSDSILTSFNDTSVKTGVIYYYSIRALDHSNLYSNYAYNVSGKPYDSGIRPAVEHFKGQKYESTVNLNWQYPILNGKEVYFVIYKKNNFGKLVQYAKSFEKTFSESSKEKEDTYAIKAITTDGGQSQLSEVLVLKLE